MNNLNDLYARSTGEHLTVSQQLCLQKRLQSTEDAQKATANTQMVYHHTSQPYLEINLCATEFHSYKGEFTCRVGKAKSTHSERSVEIRAWKQDRVQNNLTLWVQPSQALFPSKVAAPDNCSRKTARCEGFPCGFPMLAASHLYEIWKWK